MGAVRVAASTAVVTAISLIAGCVLPDMTVLDAASTSAASTVSGTTGGVGGAGGGDGGAGGGGGGGGAVCPSGQPVWATSFGDLAGQAASAIAVDAEGILVGGSYQGGFPLGRPLAHAGGTDLFLARLSPVGDPIWARGFGSPTDEILSDAAIDGSGGVLAAGLLTGPLVFGEFGLVQPQGGNDVLLARLDARGGVLWARAYGDMADQAAAAVAFGPDGNPIVAGSFHGTMTFAPTTLTAMDQDIFVAKLDDAAAGVALWSKGYGPIGNQAVTDVAVDPTGAIFLAGRFDGGADFGTGAVLSAGGVDAFVTKLDPQGTTQWVTPLGGADTEGALAVAVDASGVYVVGRFSSGFEAIAGEPLTSSGADDAFVIKLLPTGVPQWARRFGGELDDIARQVVVSGDRVFVSGEMRGTVSAGRRLLESAGQSDTFLLTYSTDGDLISARRFGNRAEDQLARLALGPGGGLLFAGGFESTLELGALSVTSKDAVDGYVALFCP